MASLEEATERALMILATNAAHVALTGYGDSYVFNYYL
jgi:hypothetical protein